MRRFILIIISIFLLPHPLYGAKKDTAAITMNIPSICKLTIDNPDLIIDLMQDASGEAAYEAGYVDGNPSQPRLVVDANTGWKLSVGVSMDWDIVEGYQKETGDLMLKVVSNTGHQVGFTTFAPLSLTDQEIASYSRGVGDDIYNCQYRIKLDWTKDVPGIYVIIITYTLSTEVL